MKRNAAFYWKLFISTFYISAFTFGGGYVIIPLLRKKFVEDLKLIEDEEMLDLTAIAQSTPGAVAVNAAVLIGYRLAGAAGVAITILGTVLPPLIILSVISLAYTAFISNVYIKFLLRGMQAGVAAVVIDVAIRMAQDLFKEKKKLPVVVLFAAFILAFFFDVNVILIILSCGLLGGITIMVQKKKNPKKTVQTKINDDNTDAKEEDIQNADATKGETK